MSHSWIVFAWGLGTGLLLGVGATALVFLKNTKKSLAVAAKLDSAVEQAKSKL